MKKNVFKKLTTLAVVLSFAGGTVSTALADPTASPTPADGTISGESTVEDVALSVEIPIDLGFTIDQFGVTDADTHTVITDNQIFGDDQIITNATTIPVKVEYDLTVTGTADVKMVDDMAKVFPDDTSKTSKDAYFAAVVATDAAGTPTYDLDHEKSIVPFVPLSDTKKGEAKFGFVLAAGGDLGGENAAAFQLYSNLNTYGAWADGDLTLSGAYTLTGVRVSSYDSIEWVDDTNAPQLISTFVAPVATPTPVPTATPVPPVVPSVKGFFNTTTGLADSAPALVVSKAASGASTPAEVLHVNLIGATGVAMKIGTNTLVKDKDYSYDVASNTVSVLRTAASLFGGAGTVNATPYSVTITTAGGTYNGTFTFTVKVNN